MPTSREDLAGTVRRSPKKAPRTIQLAQAIARKQD